jgi:hypothetical protein
MFCYERKYYTTTLTRHSAPIETYDEMMISEDGVCIKYKSKGRDLDDTFEYNDQLHTFNFRGDWLNGAYLIDIGAYLGNFERNLGVTLSAEYVLTALRNIDEAVRAWPIEGRIYKTARVNITEPIKELFFIILDWNSWQSSGLSAQIDSFTIHQLRLDAEHPHVIQGVRLR